MTDVSAGFRPPCWCPSRWAPAWRLHTILYKFGENVSPHIFHKKNCCDLNLGESLNTSTFFLFPDSRLNLLNGFYFLFWSIWNGVTLKTTNKLNDKRKLARLISQYMDIFYNISEGTAFLLQGVTEKHGKRRNMDRVHGKHLYTVFIIWLCLTSLLISARPQRQTNAEGCRNFGDLDQLKSKGTIQKTIDLSPRRREERK